MIREAKRLVSTTLLHITNTLRFFRELLDFPSTPSRDNNKILLNRKLKQVKIYDFPLLYKYIKNSRGYEQVFPQFSSRSIDGQYLGLR